MRANFAADFHAARARFAQQAHAAGRADVLAMNVMIAKLRQQNVARHDRFLARRRPAGQPEQRAPVAFMHDAVADEIVILAMIHHRHADHARILHRAAHQLVILDAMPVVRDRDHARLRERTDRRQFFARQTFRNRAGRQNIHARHFRGAILDPRDRARAVRGRRRVRHADDRGETARRRRARAGFDRFLPAEARLAEMHVNIDQARRDDQSGRVDDSPRLLVRTSAAIDPSTMKRSPTSSRRFAGSMMRPLRMIVFMAWRFLRRDKEPPSAPRGRWSPDRG